MSEYTGDAFGIGNGYQCINEHEGYIEGFVATPHGFAEVYAQYDSPVSVVRFIHKGREYWRNWDRGFTVRGLSAKAKQFAAEVVGQ